MNLAGINVVATLRRRLNAVMGAFAAAAACCVCGALMTFVFAPGQALQAFRISRMPVMDAASVIAATPGDPVLVTGVLAGNAPVLDGYDLVAYRLDEWQVGVSQDEDGNDTSSGRWESRPALVPALTLELGGQPVSIEPSSIARLGGDLAELIVEGPGPASDEDFDGRDLPDGTLRYQGLEDGDLTTVLGEKAASGGIVPSQLYGGDRAAFEESERQAASGLLFAGLCAMALSPVVLIGGILAALFGRRR